MPKLPSQSDLPGVDKDAKHVQNTLQRHIAVKLHELPPGKGVLENWPFHMLSTSPATAMEIPGADSGAAPCHVETNPEVGFDKDTRNSTLSAHTK